MKTRNSVWERVLTKHHTRKRKHPVVLGALDVETAGLGGDFIQGAYMTELDAEPIFFDSLAELFEVVTAKRNRGVIWYAHNGGEYDYKYLLEPSFTELCASHNWSIIPMLVGDRTRGIKLQRRRLTSTGKTAVDTVQLRDTFAFMPVKLADLTGKRGFNVAHGKLVGRINFEKENYDPANPRHREYLKHDVWGLLEAARAIWNLTDEHFGVEPQWTGPATAMKAFRATLDDDERYWRVNPQAEAFIRRAYYGGMVRGSTVRPIYGFLHFDVNSLYAYLATLPLPVNAARYVKARHPNAKVGFYRVIADVPESMPFTIVPHRSKHGVGFPTGHFETYLTSLEMDTAEKHGCRFQVLEGWEFTQTEPVTARFIEKCRTLRNRDYHGPIGMLAKFLQNSLTGKFGMKQQMSKLALLDTASEIGQEWCPMPGVELNPSNLKLFSKIESVERPYMMPHWVAYITAMGRVKIAESVYAVGPENFLYCDTDSLILRKEAPIHLLDVGREYGQWKMEKRGRVFLFNAPKVYMELPSRLSPFPKAQRRQHFARRPAVVRFRRYGLPITFRAKGIPSKRLTEAVMWASNRGEDVQVVFDGNVSFARVMSGDRILRVKPSKRTVPKPASMLHYRYDSKTGRVFPRHLRE